MKRVFTLLFILITFYNVGETVVLHWGLYSFHDYWKRFSSLQKTYYGSIYKNKHGSFIPDEFIYSYIGGALIKGASPILLNPEVPPFGTYLIGFSELIFGNENIVSLFFAIFSLFILYLIGLQLFSDNLKASIAPLLFSFEPIFKNQLIYTPLLDIQQLGFILVIFYLFNRAILTEKNQVLYFLFINLFIGFFISTKFFGTGIAVISSLLLPLVIRKDTKRIILFLFTTPLSVIVLYFNYIVVLISGYPFNRFIGIQKWIYIYNTGHLSNFFSVWPLILINKWYLWFGHVKISSDSQWSITWPIITICSILVIISYFFIKRKKTLEVFLSWVFFYMLILSFAQATSRYFVILIPFLYLITVYTTDRVILHLIRQKKFYENCN